MSLPVRTALAVACAGCLAAPALGAAVETTIRVEGVAQTVLARDAVELPGSGTRTVTDDVGGGTVVVPAGSATAQLDAATGRAGIPLDLTFFSFGTLVAGIGPEAAPSDFSRFWRLKVDHRIAPVGADETILGEDAEVLWSLSGFDDPELDVEAPSAPIVAGSSFTVGVRRYDNDGVAVPAAGARVVYGADEATADAAGVVTFTAGDAGPASVRAEEPGSIRDTATVCGYPAGRPEACGLDPAAPAAREAEPPAPAATAAGAGTTGAPACGPRPERTTGGGDPDRVVASPAVLRRIQRYAQVTILRTAAIERWLDDGVVGGDVCAGALDESRLGGGITLVPGGAAAAAGPAPAPRPFAVPKAPARGGGGADPVATRRIVLTAMRRVIALERRLAGGLGSADVRDGTITASRLTPGATVVAGGSRPLARPGEIAAAPVRVGRFTPGDDAARVDMRVAVAGIRRSADLVDTVRAGLTADAFAAGAIGPADLDPSTRP